MNDVTADVAQNTARNTASQRAARKAAEENLALQLCYGQIGISAVAAAVRYQGDAKNPAYAPVAMKADDRGATSA
jgi:outer membrane cobalamin receptor